MTPDRFATTPANEATIQGNVVTFAPVARMAPGEKAREYRVSARATKPTAPNAPAVVRASLTSQSLRQPLAKEVSTSIVQ